MIEADMQLIMRVFLGKRMSDKAKKDKRLLETAFSEKIKIFDCAKKTEEAKVHVT